MGWNRVRSQSRLLAPLLLLTCGLTAASTDKAHSQVVFTSISNSYITAQVGISGAPSGIAANGAGRFGVLEAGTTGGTLMNAIASLTKQSYVTVRIDGGPPTPGADANNQTRAGWDLIFGDVGTNALNPTTAGAKTDQGAWILQPTATTGNVIEARWTTLPRVQS